MYLATADELQAHLQRFPRNHDTFISHIDDAVAYSKLYKADELFLSGLLDPGRRQSDWAAAADQYVAAEQHFVLIILKYYVHDEIAAQLYPVDPATGKPRTRQTIEQIPPEKYLPLLNAIFKTESDFALAHGDEYTMDRADYMNYIHHCQGRLKYLGR